MKKGEQTVTLTMAEFNELKSFEKIISDMKNEGSSFMFYERIEYDGFCHSSMRNLTVYPKDESSAFVAREISESKDRIDKHEADASKLLGYIKGLSIFKMIKLWIELNHPFEPPYISALNGVIKKKEKYSCGVSSTI